MLSDRHPGVVGADGHYEGDAAGEGANARGPGSWRDRDINDARAWIDGNRMFTALGKNIVQVRTK